MESNTIDAIRIGVGLFIFIIALTVSITLLSTVLNISNISTNILKSTGVSNELQEYGLQEEKIVYGYDIVTYWNEYVKNATSKTGTQYSFSVEIPGELNVISLDVFTTKSWDVLRAKYKMQYNKTVANIEYYNFIQII